MKKEKIKPLVEQMQMIKIYSCKLCQHQWANRQQKVPRLCPKCKSVRWNDEIEPIDKSEKTRGE